jgi:hypothetical protein
MKNPCEVFNYMTSHARADEFNQWLRDQMDRGRDDVAVAVSVFGRFYSGRDGVMDEVAELFNPLIEEFEGE